VWLYESIVINQPEGGCSKTTLAVSLAVAAERDGKHHRIAHPRAQQTGLTAQEFEPDGKAADEIQRLYMYACMNLWRLRHAAVA
jgi:chromosome partitioning protein